MAAGIARVGRRRPIRCSKGWLFQKRTELIERTVTLFSQIPKAEGLKAGAGPLECVRAQRRAPSKRPTPEAADAALQNIAAMQDMPASAGSGSLVDVSTSRRKPRKRKIPEGHSSRNKAVVDGARRQILAFVNRSARAFTDPERLRNKQRLVSLRGAGPSNKGMKLTSAEHIGRSQLIPGVRRLLESSRVG